MATREASLGASACHLKRHHERRRGVTVVHTAGTQRSVQLPSGAIRLRTSSTRSPVRTSGGRSGRGRPRGGTSANSAGGPRCRGHGCRVCCTTVLTVVSKTLDRNTTANIERACDATHHRNQTAKRTPARLSRRGARRGRPGNKLPVQQKSTPPAPPGPARCRMPAHVPLASRGAPQRHIRISNRAPRSPPPHPDRERS
mgnify:CR=1 FL=1